MVYEAWIPLRNVLEIRPHDTTEEQAPLHRRNLSHERDFAAEGFEGLAWTSLEIERIYPFGSKEDVYANLFGDLPPAALGSLNADQIAHLGQRFASRAFRRPTTVTELAPYLALAAAAPSGVDALKAVYRGILCSPRFLCLLEESRQLDDHALASRLSFALRTSQPDAPLRALADAGGLRDSAAFRKQVDRLLNAPEADRFIESFTDQWLNLRDIDFTTPDPWRFGTFGHVVKHSMLAETRGFVGELIARDLPISHVIRSDFAMLNEHLARYYGFRNPPLQAGKGMQRVVMGNNARTGLVTQGSVLKVTANGTTTSPVLRGVWVGERILGLEIPGPPPNIPAVEPDIRGAVSIRDQLDKHRDNESCASCHNKIDPAGFALETFDPVGLPRQKYSAAPNAASVDPSGVTPEGAAFANIAEWKAIYVQQPALLARAFTRHFLTYATGAPPSFADREIVDDIVRQSAEQDYGLRSIIHAALASDIFQRK